MMVGLWYDGRLAGFEYMASCSCERGIQKGILLSPGNSYTLCEFPPSWIAEGVKAEGGGGVGGACEKGLLQTKTKIGASP